MFPNRFTTSVCVCVCLAETALNVRGALKGAECALWWQEKPQDKHTL